MTYHGDRLRANVQALCLSRFLSAVEMYECAGEPLKALALVRMPPEILSGCEEIRSAEARLCKCLSYLDDPVSKYREAAQAPLSDPNLLVLQRYSVVRQWLGEASVVTSVGPGEGSFEASIVSPGPVHDLTLIDIHDGVDAVAEAIRSKTNATVSSIVRGPSEFPVLRGTTLCLEVLEHCLDPAGFLSNLTRCLDGPLILSTPDGSVEYLPSLLSENREWYWHVSAQTPWGLGALAERVGLSVRNLASTQDGSIVLEAVRVG